MTTPPHQPWNGRVEDQALLTGHGRFHADTREEQTAAAVFVRSPHARALIRKIDTTAASKAPGVLAVFTGADMAAGGIQNIARVMPQKGRDGKPIIVPFRPALADRSVQHVGDAVVLVVAETQAAALDAAELVDVEYEPLPAVIDLHDAIAPGAPQLWPEAPGNVALDWGGPDDADGANARAIDALFAQAAHIARACVINQRIIVASMEPRGGTAAVDPVSGVVTLHAGSQGVSALQGQMIGVLGVEREKLRVVSGDVGGGFGMKSPSYPEYAAIIVAARRLGRPVRWSSTRAEAFLSDMQARDTVTEMTLAIDRNGRFLALRVDVLAAMGGYLSSQGAFISTVNFARCLPTMYDIPRIETRIRCVFTNTVPIGPYRGAGRPEANYAMERLIEEAARVTGIDSIELRRRNFIPPDRFPYRTALGAVIDGGEFAAMLDEARHLADTAGFARRRSQSEAAGKRRGLGISCFLEHAGGQPQESAAVRFPGGDTLSLALAGGASGQGHRTLYRALAAELLGIPADRIVVEQGDTRLGVIGMGTVASRGVMTSGTATMRAVEIMLEKARKMAAQVLEAAESDIRYAGGVFEIAGTDRRIGLFDLAGKAKALGESLDTLANVEVPQSFPNGCHVAEVEIDPETGVVRLLQYTAVDDCGRVLDPVMMEGQMHGAVAQGVGQALMEDAHYERDSGQLLAGTFMDYAMPRADDMPSFALASHPVPCRTNPLGVKGVGEAGTTGALAAVMNAIADAIPTEAGRRLDMPATPLKVWRACRTLT
ncbi:MAG TPA: xanthine dehydrogenase family protein molybdopterin-binding subunit [Stellaceae bacterium]|nr:xanthine dehydrogenase family protein molybdopterin-binding subunit [Stellaceae bacterium]